MPRVGVMNVHYCQTGGRCWRDLTGHDIRQRTMTGGVCEGYLLLGWVEVFRSSLKKHSDLLTLGDVDWQLNEGLQTQRDNRIDRSSHMITSLHTEVTPRLNIVLITCLLSKNKPLLLTV